MADLTKSIYSPESINDIAPLLQRFPEAQIFAGGTALLAESRSRRLEIANTIIDLSKISELRQINRSERYLEIGAMVPLAIIEKLGKNIHPLLNECISYIANPAVRNLATVGGNLCWSEKRLDTHAALLALDAKIELRSSSASRWISLNRFENKKNILLDSERAFLTRIRIPFDRWDYWSYVRLGNASVFDTEAWSVAIIAKSQKNVVSALHSVCCGAKYLRNREADQILSGKNLPFRKKDIQIWLTHWDEMIQKEIDITPIHKNRLLNILEDKVSLVSDEFTLS